MSVRSGRGTSRRGFALVMVTLLFPVLSVLGAAAVTYLASTANADSQATRRTLVFYAAEAARAHATARVKAGASSEASGLLPLRDSRGVTVAEYSYTITDISLPEQPQRRKVQLLAYWPAQSGALARQQATVYLEKQDTTWSLRSYASGAN